MNHIKRRRLENRKRRIQRRLAPREWQAQSRPMFRARNIRYEIADKSRGLACGGIGAMHLLAQRVGLVEAIDADLRLLKVHLPYHESDHVLNIAYNLICNGTCLEDIELRRNDEVFLDALGAQRIPDPTTAGDFCRRFEEIDVELLMEAINSVRLRVWRQQPDSFFDEARIDADGTLTETTGECKQGMDIAYNGKWGYHPLLVSLANTGEPLYISNRSGNRPSHEGAAQRLDLAIDLCRRGGFRRILLRGDTDFTQTGELDRWDQDGVNFIFGVAAMANLVEKAENLPEYAWSRLERPAKHIARSAPRRRPENVKEQIVREREYENIRLRCEDVAEFAYRPVKCKRSYRIVALRKNLTWERGERALFDDVRYFFYITNDEERTATEIVFLANERCDQENLIEQLKNGVRALNAPSDNLVSNWAYMVMGSLAWTLKAWYALLLPEEGRWRERHRAEKETVLRMEFKRFCQAFIQVPCQIVRSGRRIVYRLLAWNPWQSVFWRALESVSRPLRC